MLQFDNLSQGGVVAVQAALMLNERVGGVLALSTWLGSSLQPAGTVKAGLPVLLCHGGADVVVPTRFAREASDTLKRLGLSVLLKTYDMMGHAFCAQVPLTLTFLKTCLVTSGSTRSYSTFRHSYCSTYPRI
jgi:predicted esterase